MSVSGTATRSDGRGGSRIGAGEAAAISFGRDGDCFCWLQRDLPVRLLPSDLCDPRDFHRRLSDWLMQQR